MNQAVLERDLHDFLAPSQVSTEAAELDRHAGESGFGADVEPQRPDVVVFPEDVFQVAAICSFASRTGVPIVPVGTRTGVGGMTRPAVGGISLDMTRMDDLVAIHAQDFAATVQPGLTRVALNHRLAGEGLFFPVDPGADASLGGMAATNASGSRAMRYGAMRSNVLALQVVLADGSIVRTGTRARKSSAGYDLTRLLVGSEGTLGVITELTLRLHAIPQSLLSARAAFPDADAALRTVVAITRTNLAVDRLEFLDGPTVGLVNDYKGTTYVESPTLLIEFAGPEETVLADTRAAQKLALEAGGTTFEFEREAAGQARLWEARHHVGFAILARHPGKSLVGTDVCVPVSELPAAIRLARRLLDERGLEASVIAHAGDGNYHLTFAIDRQNPVEVGQVQSIYADLIDHALARGGTCSGEHGIGLAKIEFLEREHGDLIPAMRAIKQGLDPAGILNPGKILRSV
jgi:D-lactate dehydrogenase (cytochrome)